MSVYAKNKVQDPVTISRTHLLQYLALEDINHFYLSTILMLFRYIKDFSFDLQDIGAEDFKSDIDNLAQHFETKAEMKKIKHIFDEHQDGIASFIGREKKYLTNREGELKKIIHMLSQGILTLHNENEAFNNQIHDGGEKLKKITQLDDLRKVKMELKVEVGQIKALIKRKKEQDAIQMKLLSGEVEELKDELKKTKNISMTDGLTGAYNRLTLDSHISDLIEDNTIFSLMVIDIDNFKQINDTYGHRVGDRIIITLVQKCKKLIREGDFLARYGGEEFVVILPGTSLSESLDMANVFCKEIAVAQYAIDSAELHKTLSFTVSIGVSERKDKDTPESIFERADQALYAAKRAGKNQALGEIGIN